MQRLWKLILLPAVMLLALTAIKPAEAEARWGWGVARPWGYYPYRGYYAGYAPPIYRPYYRGYYTGYRGVVGYGYPSGFYYGYPYSGYGY